MALRKGAVLAEKNLNENFHLAPTLFSHLPGFYLKTGFLNPPPLSLEKVETILKSKGQQIKTIQQSDQVS